MALPLLLALLWTAAAEEGRPSVSADDARPNETRQSDVRLNDARLNDVAFVTAEKGWAVGDRGAIWHTDDGGKQWLAQDSGVACRLTAVCFRNENLGWVAGGFSHPYSHTSAGVVLMTRDGGRTWTNVLKLALPALRCIRFFDDQHGWALGCPSAMYPSGVFLSDDSGRTWGPLPGGKGGGWATGDLFDPRTGALAGGDGILASLRGGEMNLVPYASAGLPRLLQLRLSGSRVGWVVGEGGTALCTSDRGMAWQPPPAALPRAAQLFDFAALAVRNSQCWIAGTPGTRVFHSGDAGQSWSAFPTGSLVPLRAMTFVDDAHGWAVGDLGTILATDDGGRTWQRQRSGGVRAAVLALWGEADDVPLELLARLAGNEGYLAAVEVLGRRDIEVRSREDVPLADRLQEAVVQVGGSSTNIAWQFPLRQAGLQLDANQIVGTWDRIHDSRGIAALQDHIVRQICVWRPDVIVTQGRGRPEDDPFDAIVHQAVLQAMIRAANADNFIDRLAEAGLEPWSVKKAFAMQPAGARGDVELPTAQLASRLGGTLADAASEPRGLLLGQPMITSPTMAFRFLASDGTQEQERRDFFGGIVLPSGGEARRHGLPTAPEGFSVMQRSAQKRRHIQAILERSERVGGSAEQLLAQVNELTRDLDDRSAGQILYQLADRYRHTGSWSLAAETFQVLAERFPNHSLTPQSLLWLVQFHASEEAAWRSRSEPAQHVNRYQRALELGKEVERTRPEWFAEPLLQFPLAAALRNLQQTQQAVRCYMLQNRGSEQDAWWECAQSELRLIDSKGMPPRPTLSAVRAETPPHLDGLLDDPVWQKAKPIAVQSRQHDDGDWPAEVLLAYDAEFLYIAARCGRGSQWGRGAAAPDGPRPRDADLSTHDRIEILLDLDRDFVTYYRLAVDDRGWTNDAWWDDRTWDPAWYVATDRTDDNWTFEAAVPLAQLSGRPPKARDTWAVGIQRVVPGVGFQSWTHPAALAVMPEGFGYMVFE